jgi:hypothetical protein
MNNHDWHNYFGPAMGWLVNALMWAIGGMSPLAAAGAVAALWWTIERAKTERAKRRMIEGVDAEVQRGGLAARLKKALKTEPGGLS